MSKEAWIPKILPSNWIKIPIHDLCNVVRGGSPRPMGDPRYFNGNIPFIKISDVTCSDGITVHSSETKVNEEGAKKSRLLQKGTLVLSNSGTVCVPIFLGVDACIHDGFVTFDSLSEEIDRKYLYHFFKYIRPYILDKHKQGVTQVNLNTTLVGEIDLLFPPANEQKRIVAKIEELFSELEKGIESLKTARAQLKIYRQAVLKYAFEGKLTADWREKNKVSDTWITVTVDDIGDISTGSTPPTKNPELYGNEYPFFKPTDLEAGFNVIESRDYLSHAGYESARQVPADSVLVTCIGATIGKTGIIRRDGAFNQQINAIVPYPQFLPEFVYFQAIGSEFQEHIKTNYSQTTLPILNKSKFSRLPFVICSKKEQAEIVERLKAQMSVIDKIEEEIETQLQKSEALRQSILKKAFSGQLVAQDPADEPASVLLERIRAEKMGQSAKKNPKEKRRGV
jgi:type I restriction enzyme S subunit